MWVSLGLYLGSISLILGLSWAQNDGLSYQDLAIDASMYMDVRNQKEATMANLVCLASWNYESNFTDNNRNKMMAAQKDEADFGRKEWAGFKFWKTKWQNLADPDLKRQFYVYSIQGRSALPEDKLTRLDTILSDMSTTYSTAKVDLCTKYKGKEKCQLNLEPELTELLTSSRNASLLTDIWQKWRDVSGKAVREKYIEYVSLSNEMARLNNFTDMGAMWLEPYETEDFPAEVSRLWAQLKPLYQQIHAYVRRKLREKYGAALVPPKSMIPAQLLGNMWAQTWEGVDEIVTPYPAKGTVDVTQAMKEQGYTPLKMFKLAEQFFKDLNLTAMTDNFWKNSIIEKPTDREMTCHASAWDFYDGQDFRIKMCTRVTMTDLITIHHEMGHIQYYMQYRNLPQVFRTGANPGFHEAVGDSLALSVQTPKHLHKINLLTETDSDEQSQINFLMNMALQKVVFLPFGYLIDKYRWDVFSGNITSDKLNEGWWKLRHELQGITAPVQRDEQDFDAGAKYHVVADVPYIRYFVSFVIQFQFHKAMCLKANQYVPNDPTKRLHNCDINLSTEAGNALADMLKLGASKPWPDALEALTGTRKMDASVLREYFAPLEEWLIEDNQRNGEYIGWEV